MGSEERPFSAAAIVHTAGSLRAKYDRYLTGEVRGVSLSLRLHAAALCDAGAIVGSVSDTVMIGIRDRIAGAGCALQCCTNYPIVAGLIAIGEGAWSKIAGYIGDGLTGTAGVPFLVALLDVDRGDIGIGCERGAGVVDEGLQVGVIEHVAD